MKGNFDLALASGWEAERFARTKNIKALADYLKPPPTPEGRRQQGARDVKRMLDRMIKKQEAAGGAE
jgi:hypothetical protein